MMELKNKKEMKVHTDTEDKFRQISFPAIILIGSNKSLDKPTSTVTAYQLLHKKQGDVMNLYYKTEANMKRRKNMIKAERLLFSSKKFVPLLLVKKTGEKLLRVVYVPIADAKTIEGAMKYINSTYKRYEDYQLIFNN